MPLHGGTTITEGAIDKRAQLIESKKQITEALTALQAQDDEVALVRRTILSKMRGMHADAPINLIKAEFKEMNAKYEDLDCMREQLVNTLVRVNYLLSE